jgi:hypothetical protein
MLAGPQQLLTHVSKFGTCNCFEMRLSYKWKATNETRCCAFSY